MYPKFLNYVKSPSALEMLEKQKKKHGDWIIICDKFIKNVQPQMLNPKYNNIFLARCHVV
jgi:hypothetical protein